jgi:hypothetical protein
LEWVGGGQPNGAFPAGAPGSIIAYLPWPIKLGIFWLVSASNRARLLRFLLANLGQI